MRDKHQTQSPRHYPRLAVNKMITTMELPAIIDDHQSKWYGVVGNDHQAVIGDQRVPLKFCRSASSYEVKMNFILVVFHNLCFAGINSASNAVRQGPSVGKAAIGGPFNLIDHNGKAVTDKNFMGNWNLIYFGFTHCPDICPDELQKLAAAIDKIKEKSGMEVVPVFISVDPERDTVEQVREYVKEFHPKLIGLTGSSEEIKKAARAYRVYYMKTEEEGSDYLVDHSIVMYLMDPNMQFVKFFGKNVDTDSLADGVVQEIKQHKVVKA
ncbi:protein SCO1 homolog 1, mitochondrial-like [Olea europaea var. sylvestris]|uniref:protein SCO1 homolog 1, mitochondrial-like n=1 Tax=Olea europaea var. sylvestris TaxID=158386 RepID=UPI000C1D65A8|nr:protein SCO1 homolog 1, mitochondrial-like [Olea europaea var. sylvestris]